MPSDKKKRRPVLVQMETPNLIPERDLGSIPVLQAEHLGVVDPRVAGKDGFFCFGGDGDLGKAAGLFHRRWFSFSYGYSGFSMIKFVSCWPRSGTCWRRSSR